MDVKILMLFLWLHPLSIYAVIVKGIKAQKMLDELRTQERIKIKEK